MLAAQRVGLAQIGHGDGLAASHVDVGRHARCRGSCSAPTSAITASQLVQVDVALERMRAGRVVGLVDDHVDEAAARAAPGGSVSW